MGEIGKSKVSMLPDEWNGIDEKLLQEEVIEVSKPVGLYAQVPSRCRESCTCKKTCRAYLSGQTHEGMTCIKEAAVIINNSSRYCEDLEIDRDKDFIDLQFVKDLVACDVIINRCNEYLRDKDIIVNEVFTVTKEGEAIEQTSINKALNILDMMLNKKDKILRALNGTRKDKAQSGKETAMDMAQMLAMAKQHVIENGEVV